MNLWREYKSLGNKELIRIVEGEVSSLQRGTAARELLLRGGDDVIRHAMELCSRKNYKLREAGAQILGQVVIPSHNTLLKVIKTLASLASREKSIRVRYTAIYSLGHRCAKGFVNDRLMLAVLKKATEDKSASVRNAAAFALAEVKSSHTAQLLDKLLRDTDKDVRSWAGYAVNQSGSDSVKIRDALVIMLDDDFEDARLEAITALASRKDQRVVFALKHELEKDPLDLAMVEAAGKLGDPGFIPILEELFHKFDDEDGLIQRAVNQLKNNAESLLSHKHPQSKS